MVTHDPRAAVRAERVLHLDKGQLVDDIEQPGLVYHKAAGPHAEMITKRPGTE
jgi:hypothetical protein